MWKIHKKLPIIKNLSAADFILNTGTLYCTENRKLEKSYHSTLTGYNLKIINSHITDCCTQFIIFAALAISQGVTSKWLMLM